MPFDAFLGQLVGDLLVIKARDSLSQQFFSRREVSAVVAYNLNWNSSSLDKAVKGHEESIFVKRCDYL